MTEIIRNMAIHFVKDDGGRAAAGFKGDAGDCVARAVAIASGRGYSTVYNDLAAINAAMRKTKRRKKGSVGSVTARDGIYMQSKLFKDYMARLGFRWVSTMAIGSGCKVHLRADELPAGRLVVRLSRHAAAVVDRVLHDNHDCSREGTRGVYGYWIFEGARHENA